MSLNRVSAFFQKNLKRNKAEYITVQENFTTSIPDSGFLNSRDWRVVNHRGAFFPKHMKVVVTGATGFISSHLIRNLLHDGIHVSGTVRPNHRKSYDHLFTFPNSENLEIIEVDLHSISNTSVNFHEILDGVSGVFHTACPLTPTEGFYDPKIEMLDPSLSSTLNILVSCEENNNNLRQGDSGINRVVLTSSIVAVRDVSNPNIDENHVFTEDDWNNYSTLEQNPYAFSKTITETEAFNFFNNEPKSFDLVTILPSLTFGPVLHSTSNDTSLSVRKLIKLLSKDELSNERICSCVDVRDVAQLHQDAFFEDSCSMERFLITTDGFVESEIYESLRLKLEDVYGTDSPIKLKDKMIVGDGNIKKDIKTDLLNLRKIFGKEKSDLISPEQSVFDTINSLFGK